jgi:Domain of unknown function (DUF4114)
MVRRFRPVDSCARAHESPTNLPKGGLYGGPVNASDVDDPNNPGGAPQVLSGMPPGTHTLQIGFEDMQNGKGDNDFQDVVVSINASHGYLLG